MLDHLTHEFVRQDAGCHGTQFSDADCNLIITEVKRLAAQGEFDHSVCIGLPIALPPQVSFTQRFQPQSSQTSDAD